MPLRPAQRAGKGAPDIHRASSPGWKGRPRRMGRRRQGSGNPFAHVRIRQDEDIFPGATWATSSIILRETSPKWTIFISLSIKSQFLSFVCLFTAAI